MATTPPVSPSANEDYAAWADLNGRWFFAWRMATACQEALCEVHQAMKRHPSPNRLHALERASQLFRRELVRWVRRGEALHVIVQRTPSPPE